MRKSLLFIPAVILLLAIVGYSFKTTTINQKQGNTLKKYGPSFNAFRSSNGIPTIESNWIALEVDSSHIHWTHSDRRINQVRPFHLYKTIYLTGDNISYEKDAFHYEGSSNTAYRFFILSYIDSKSNRLDSFQYKLVTYFKGKYPPSITKNLSKNQSDSLIAHWKKVD